MANQNLRVTIDDNLVVIHVGSFSTVHLDTAQARHLITVITRKIERIEKPGRLTGGRRQVVFVGTDGAHTETIDDGPIRREP